MDFTRLQRAQWMAGKEGFRVFIVKPGEKNPLYGWSWYSRSTDDAAEVAELFAATPDCNYGVWPGEDNVVIDLDLDPEKGKDGISIFNSLCQEHGLDSWEDLNTFSVRTPSGGIHIYFKSPFPCGLANDFPAGIDVRGTNGYVVGPDSELVDDDGILIGVYQVVDPDASLIPLPDWLAEFMYPPGKRNPKADIPLIELDLEENIEHAVNWLKDREHACEGQHGDQWTLETIYFMRDFGLSKEMTRWAMNQGWNQRCEPPWSDGELTVKIDNAWSYPQNRPGCKSPTYRVHRINLVAGMGVWQKYTTPEAVAEMFRPTHNLRLVVDNTPGANEVPDDVDDDETDPVTGEPSSAFPWYDLNEFADRGSKREYVINEWLLSHGITHMVAKRGTGKSTVALDMAFHIACDLNWCGLNTKAGWKVIYICGEDDVGMEVNVNAWIAKHNKKPEFGRFLVAADVIKLTDDLRLDIRIKEMMDWAGDSRTVVFLDTWQRSTMGWSKNDQEAMEEAVTRAEKIAKYLRGPLVSLVHPPKDGRMTVKGAGEQEDTSTGIWHLEESLEGVRMKVERIKGAGRNNYVDFRMAYPVIEGTEDDFGNPMTGLVLEYTRGSIDKGTQASKERHDLEMSGWADIIVGADFRKTRNRYAELPEVKSLSVHGVSDFLDFFSQVYGGDSAASRDAEDFARDNMQVLLTGSIPSKFNKSFVTRELERLFKTTPTAFSTNSRYKVEYKVPEGQKKPKFFIEAVQTVENE